MSTAKLRNIIVGTIVAGAGLFLSENIWTTTNSPNFVSQAEARLGRPGTPLSVAGVARRHYRRAAVAGAVAGGALAGYGYGIGGYGYGTGYPYSGYASYGYPYSSYSFPYYGTYNYQSYGSPYYGTYGYQSYSYPYSYATYGWRRRWW